MRATQSGHPVALTEARSRLWTRRSRGRPGVVAHAEALANRDGGDPLLCTRGRATKELRATVVMRLVVGKGRRPVRR